MHKLVFSHLYYIYIEGRLFSEVQVWFTKAIVSKMTSLRTVTTLNLMAIETPEELSYYSDVDAIHSCY